MAISILVNGVDRTPQFLERLAIEATLGARTIINIASVDRTATAASYRPVIDQSVVARANGVAVFTGTILGVDDGPVLPPNVGTRVAVRGVSLWSTAAQRRVSATYPAGTTLKAAAADLVARFLAPFGITLDPTMADGPALPDTIFDYATVEEAFNRLAEVTAWVYRLTPANVVQWFVIGTKVTGITFSEANGNIIGPVAWTQQRNAFANRQIVRYGVGLVAKIDHWVGDGVTVRFPLSYPLAITGWVTYNGDPYPPPGGHEGVGPGNPWLYDPATNELVRNVGAAIPGPGVAAPPAPGVPFLLEYSCQYPLTVVAENAADVAARGPWEELTEAPDIFETAAAQAYAESRVRKTSVAPRQATIATRIASDFLPGDTVSIDVPGRTIPNTPWLVTAVSLVADVDHVLRCTLTLLEGSEQQASWIDYWREQFGVGSSSVGIVSGGAIPTTPGGGTTPPTGGGTPLPPYLAYTNVDNVFTTGQSIYCGPSTTGLAIYGRDVDGWPVFTFYPKSGGANIGQMYANPTMFYQVYPSHLFVHTATGHIFLDPVGGYVMPQYPYRYSLGHFTNKWLGIHAAELWVETLVAQQTLATIGGRILVGPTTMLARDITDTTSQYIVIYLKHNSVQPPPPGGTRWGSTLLLESGGKFEAMSVVSALTAEADGSFSCSVGRKGPTYYPWYAGDAVFDTGLAGNGFIDLYSLASVGAASGGLAPAYGPTIVGNVRTHDFPGYWMYWEPRWAIGNLNGLYYYGSNTYGAAFGSATGTNVCIDATYGYRIRFQNTVLMQCDVNGNLTLMGALTVGGSASINAGNTVISAGGISVSIGSTQDNVYAFNFRNPQNSYLGMYCWDNASNIRVLQFSNVGHGGAATTVISAQHSDGTYCGIQFDAVSFAFGGEANMYFRAGRCVPLVSSPYLGDATHKWQEVWAVNGVIQTSDAATKTDLTPNRLGLAFLERLPVHAFRYHDDPTPRIGFTTQDVEAALEGVPWNAVAREGSGPAGLNYPAFVPVLTQAIQELAARLRAVEERRV